VKVQNTIHFLHLFLKNAAVERMTDPIISKYTEEFKTEIRQVENIILIWRFELTTGCNNVGPEKRY
jgi:hypothetical protein